MRHTSLFLFGLLSLAALAACEDDTAETVADAAPADATTADAGGADAHRPDADLDRGPEADAELPDAQVVDAALAPDMAPPGGDRPAQVFPAEGPGPHPILLVLHGYQINSTLMLNNYPVHRTAPARGVIVVAPDGTVDETGARFWDAEHCCPERMVDDAGYLVALVDEVVARYDGDPTQVYVFGHSNGGYMAHHLACVAADHFAGIFALSGLGYPRDRCQPARQLAVWQIHGTADPNVAYEGSETQPGTDALAEWWADHNGCTGSMDLPPINYVDPTAGDETTRTVWSGCAPGAEVVRWRMEGVRHIVFPNADFLSAIVDRVAPR